VHDLQIEWLLEHPGPIVRWRVIRDLGVDIGGVEKAKIYCEVLATEDVQRWLANFGDGPVHHSRDSAVENSMGKLVE
jgi:hypothetical protein